MEIRNRQHLTVLGAMLATALLAGCATAAQRQAQETAIITHAAGAQFKECIRAVVDSPAYTELLPHKVSDSGPTMTQLTDETLPTKSEARLLAARHDQNVPCRRDYLSSIASARPDAVPIFTSEWAASDQNLVQLIERKITWGEYFRRGQTLVAKLHENLSNADHQWAADLNAQHQAELAQRQAAGAALMQWSQQQQLINAATRPITTNCNRIGQSVNCTSY